MRPTIRPHKKSIVRHDPFPNEVRSCNCSKVKQNIRNVTKARDFFKRRGDTYQRQLNEREEVLFEREKTITSLRQDIERQRTDIVRLQDQLLVTLFPEPRRLPLRTENREQFTDYQHLVARLLNPIPTYINDPQLYMSLVFEFLGQVFGTPN